MIFLVLSMILGAKYGVSLKLYKGGPMTFNDIAKESITKFGILFPSILMLSVQKSNAVKGAFELDAEYYLKSLIQPNEKTNKKIIAESNVKYSSPRTLDIDFANDINNCILDAIELSCKINRKTFLKNVEDNLSYSIKYFKTFCRMDTETLSDQHYFDMILYLYYLEAGKFLQTSETRVSLRKTVGDNILRRLQTKYQIITPNSINSESSQTFTQNEKIKIKSENLFKLGKGINQILSIFKSKSIIRNYIFDDENFTDLTYIHQSFKDNVPINFQITAENPATIISYIEQYKMDTFYHPEIIATTICSLGKQFNFNLEFEDYLLDNEYRTDNFDVQAQDVLYEFLQIESN